MNPNSKTSPVVKDIRIPDDLLSGAKRSFFYTFENVQIGSDEDMERLIQLMAAYPDRRFYVFAPKTEGANPRLLAAEMHGILDIPTCEHHYYRHPNFKQDWVKIDRETERLRGWQKGARDNTPEFLRLTIRLTERWRRKLELQEALAESKPADQKPLLSIKPGLWGINFDLQEAWRRWKAKRAKGKG